MSSSMFAWVYTKQGRMQQLMSRTKWVSILMYLFFIVQGISTESHTLHFVTDWTCYLSRFPPTMVLWRGVNLSIEKNWGFCTCGNCICLTSTTFDLEVAGDLEPPYLGKKVLSLAYTICTLCSVTSSTGKKNWSRCRSYQLLPPPHLTSSDEAHTKGKSMYPGRNLASCTRGLASVTSTYLYIFLDNALAHSGFVKWKRSCSWNRDHNLADTVVLAAIHLNTTWLNLENLQPNTSAMSTASL